MCEENFIRSFESNGKYFSFLILKIFSFVGKASRPAPELRGLPFIYLVFILSNPIHDIDMYSFILDMI